MLDKSRHDAHTRSRSPTTQMSAVLVPGHHPSWSCYCTRLHHDLRDDTRDTSIFHCWALSYTSSSCHTDEEDCLSDGWQSSYTCFYDSGYRKSARQWSRRDTHPHDEHLTQQVKNSSGRIEDISDERAWLNFSFKACKYKSNYQTYLYASDLFRWSSTRGWLMFSGGQNIEGYPQWSKNDR